MLEAIGQNPRITLVCALGAGAAVYYGGTTALVVGTVALAAIALVVCAVWAWKQRSVEKQPPFLTPKTIEDENESSSGKINWKMKLLNTDIVIEEHPPEKKETLYSELTDALIRRCDLQSQTVQDFKTILLSNNNNPFLRGGNDQIHFILPVVPKGPRLKFDPIYDTFVVVYKAVNEFLVKGGKAHKISLLIPDGSEVISTEAATSIRKRLRQELKPALMSGNFQSN